MRRALFRALALLAACDKRDDNVWQGYVEGEYVMLASPYAGQLQKLYVRRGDQVEPGKPVSVLEQESERAGRVHAEQLQRLYVRGGDQVEAENPAFVPEQESGRAARGEAEQRLKSAQSRIEN